MRLFFTRNSDASVRTFSPERGTRNAEQKELKEQKEQKKTRSTKFEALNSKSEELGLGYDLLGLCCRRWNVGIGNKNNTFQINFNVKIEKQFVKLF